MPWIESHAGLVDHPKTVKAAHLLGVDQVIIVGHLHVLWHWALTYAEFGDLSHYDHADIALAAKWHGDPKAFVEALIDCGPGDKAGFLERDGSWGPPDDPRTGKLVLHDWWDYAGKLVDRRWRDAQRKREARASSNGQPDPDPTPSNGRPQDRPQDVPETPGRTADSHPDTDPRARTHPPTKPTPPARAHAKPASYPQQPPADVGGEEKPPDPKQRADRALHRIRGGMPATIAGRLDQQHQQAVDALTPLTLAGWQPRELADAISQRGWDGIHDPAAILKRRAANLDGEEPPSLRARRAREPPDGCPNEHQHGRLVDDDGRPEPCPCGWTPDAQEAS